MTALPHSLVTALGYILMIVSSNFLKSYISTSCVHKKNRNKNLFPFLLHKKTGLFYGFFFLDKSKKMRIIEGFYRWMHLLYNAIFQSLLLDEKFSIKCILKTVIFFSRTKSFDSLIDWGTISFFGPLKPDLDGWRPNWILETRDRTEFRTLKNDKNVAV